MRFDIEVHYLTHGREDWKMIEATHPDPIKDPIFNTLKWTGPNKESYEFKADIYLRHSVKNRSISDIEPKYDINRQIGLLAYSRLSYITRENEISSYIDGTIDRNAYILHIEIVDNEFGLPEPQYTISIIGEGDTINKVVNSPSKRKVFECCLVDEVYDSEGNIEKKKNDSE